MDLEIDQLAGQKVGDYILSAFITETNLSAVYESTDTKSQNCTKLAIKLLKKTNSYTQIVNEINFNRSNNCNYIMPIIDIIEKVPFKDVVIAIVMKNAIGTDLLQTVLYCGPLDEAGVSQVAHAGLMALKYLHKDNNIMHRDIKPDNFFLMDDSLVELDIVLGDLGHATKFTPGLKLNDYKVGSLIYNAPEIIKEIPYDESIDIWSLGVTLYFVISGNFAFFYPAEEFNSDSELLTKQAIINRDIDIETGVWANISPMAKDFICSMIQVDPEKRLSIDELLNHPFMVNNYVEYNKQRNRAEGKNIQVDESLDQANKFLGDDN